MSLKSALSYVTASTVDQHLQSASINFTSGGDNTIVAGIAGLGIYVFKYWLVVGATTSLTYKSGATALTGPVPLIANEAMVFTFDTRPWYEIDIGSDFIINSSSGGTQVSGRVHYVQL